jgi:hypothetical protein
VEAPELDGSKVQIPLAVVDFDEACGAFQSLCVP